MEGLRIRVVALSVIVLCLVVPGAGALELQADETYLAGTSVAALATADLDRDGDADLVVADGLTSEVSVLLGDGAGGFVAGTIRYPMADDPVEVAVGDLNRDGIADLITAGAATSRVHYRLGDGAGGFRGLRTQNNGSSAPGALAVADLNADGRLDVVTANPTAATVSVLRGDGRGDFEHAPGSPYSAAVAGNGIATGDMNSDSILDVAVSAPEGVAVLSGTGNGRLVFAWLEAVAAGELAVARLDGDGHVDALVGTSSGLAVLHGDGAGRFTGPATTYALGPVTAVTTGDLDADGSHDVLASTTDGLHVLLADGSGAHAEAGDSPWASQDAVDIATPDVDGDGLDDVVVARAADVAVIRNASERGAVADPAAVDFGSQPVASSAHRLIRVSGDGLPTLVEGIQLDAGAFTVADDGCSGRTVADARPPCAITVRFSPREAGPHHGTLTVASDGGDIDVPLHGSGADVDAPETTITERPSETTTDDTPTFTFTSSEDGSSFSCTLDGSIPQPCSSPHTTPPLSTSTHTFTVAATDAAGNADPSPASATFTVIAPPPDVVPDTTITEHPDALTNDTTPTFRFTSDSAGSTFVCSIDGNDPAGCTSPHTTDVLDEGPHMFSVAAVGASGAVDPTPDTFDVTVDVTAPRTAIRGPSTPTRRHARYTFRFTEDIARVQCSIDGSGFSDCRTPYNARALRPGRHVLRVQAIDPAGNVESPVAIKRFRIERG